MYTIKQASLRSGVSVPLLRAWERRYGVVAPQRTASRYRLYTETDIERLRTMRMLVDGGWSAGQAADQVRDAGDDALRALESDLRAERGVREGPGSTTATSSAFVAAAARLDGEAMDRILDEMLSTRRFETAVDEGLLPAMEEVGAAWARGELDVAAEHAASEAVLRRLGAAFEAAGRTREGPRTVIGMPRGAHHELAALAFAVAARRAGVDVVYLGADVPDESWVRAVAETGARAVVMGAVMPADAESASDALKRLAETHPSVVRAVGGRYASRTVGSALVLPERVTDALAIFLEALPRG
jgi:DNA-binding transcriptional MerR regulator/methylmalonyl-CoA mutase cobalamin-binding subunit